ncbi:type II toxin-antitoxin system VapC family toxin [Acidithiobacillus concretivorus]|uniref:Type II toxin-antitoxin system VapC family toxin n=1 Tax=Acidithiobacillus concretivorus TaxID=3063952 RepID=A0ABS5ZRT4_9PROT|nr:type II toxin-antitoxin system VapC family toxin [Acidithiobacillus concretivorus]MBU2739388.1 type II toxin-antitoxin system VapC family toxin [Acidithiobacillus concretivorus]
MFLLDTDIISELRRPKPHGGVLAWIEQMSDVELHLAAVTIGEIQAGIEITKEQDKVKAEELTAWLDQVAGAYNVLPMDGAVFREWARLMHRKSETLYEDAMIAATARVHGLTRVQASAAPC